MKNNVSFAFFTSSSFIPFLLISPVKTLQMENNKQNISHSCNGVW